MNWTPVNYIIFISVFQVIVFDFQHLDIETKHGEYSSSCPYDYLQIYDGRDSDDYLLRTYCATKEHGIATFKYIDIIVGDDKYLSRIKGYGDNKQTGKLSFTILISGTALCSQYTGSFKCPKSINIIAIQMIHYYCAFLLRCESPMCI